MYRDAQRFSRLFHSHKPIIGMVHLRALPGSPGYEGSMKAVLEAALRDADSLEQGGVDGIMIENFFDSPFFKDRVGPETVAAMSSIITAIRQRTTLPLGVNVLRNDGMSAVAIATACGCQLVRINQLSWAMLADQGILEGQAAQILRYRRQLDSDVLIMADCLTKHAAPLAIQPMELVAMDTWERGGADALVISGVATGKPTDLQDVIAARQGAPDAPILIGSGITDENLLTLLSVADSVLVGTYLKVDGKVENTVDIARVRRLVEISRTAYPA
ncbi:MAG TPA: BtpA/SgcQ family protein [Aggregatilineales bacterium]|nr:BtpA/SgcQ family protein [Aggregatilineales bacterium]